MRKKKLLSEATVRQFMKYANIGHLTENFIDEGELYSEEEDEDFPPESEVTDPVGELPPEVGEPGEEFPAEPEGVEPLPPEAVSALEGAVEDAVDALFTALAPFGVEGEATVTEPEVTEPEVTEPEVIEPEVTEPEITEPVEDEEGVLEGVDMIDEDEVVNETLRRVSRRIRGMQKRERLAETLTNRIMKRLSKNK